MIKYMYIIISDTCMHIHEGVLASVITTRFLRNIIILMLQKLRGIPLLHRRNLQEKFRKIYSDKLVKFED